MLEAQARDTNHIEVYYTLVTSGSKHILKSRTIAEGPIFLENRFIVLNYDTRVTNN